MGVSRRQEEKSLPESDRVSIWSIADDWRIVFYILLSIEVTVIVALVGWREISQVTGDTPVETILAIGTGAAPNIFTAAAINIAIIFQAEVIDMLAERYKRMRFRAGMKEGARRYAAKIQAWAERKIEAAEKGEPFDEPMPEPDDDDDEAA